jgi:hypothetical protein
VPELFAASQLSNLPIIQEVMDLQLKLTLFFTVRLLFVFQLSAYVLHTLPVHWPNAVPELMATLQPSNLPNIPPEKTAWILLEILTVLPEEVRAICVFRINICKSGCHFI